VIFSQTDGTRFVGLLGSFVHFHVVVPDGVFFRDDDGCTK
jgi:hypothetical protein